MAQSFRRASTSRWTAAESFETGLRKTVEWYLANGPWIEGVTSGAYRQWIDSNYSDRTGLTGSAHGTAEVTR